MKGGIMLTAKIIRAALSARHEKLTEEMDKHIKATGKTIDEITAEDPFLAGQMYMLGMIELDLLIAVHE
jgi:hypothetical protein